MATLEDDGYQVIPGVIRDFEGVRDSLWRELMELVPDFDPRAEAPYEARRGLFSLQPMHAMLFQHYVGHLQTVWDLRQRPEVVDVFADIWGTRELYVSFDGISALVPPETTNRGFNRPSTEDWLHADQRPQPASVGGAGERLAIQGYITLYDAGPQDATLGVIPGSHLEDRSGMTSKGDWLLLPGRQDEVVRVEAKAGDMVLWDSRTAHQGTLPIRGRPPVFTLTGTMHGHVYAPRLVVYVCMLPRSRLIARQSAKRQQWFTDHRMTNHWGTKLFPRTPRIYGGERPVVQPIRDPMLSDLGRSLI